MNYRMMTVNELKKTLDNFPNNTMGQIIHSVISNGEKNTKSIKEWLFNVSDEDFYTALEKANKNEQPEKEYFNQ